MTSAHGSIEWDLSTGVARCTQRVADILGYRSVAEVPAPERWSSATHPDDLGLVRRLMVDHLKGRTPGVELELRLRHQSGRWVWVAARAEVVSRDDVGRATQMLGTLSDLTESRKRERLLRAVAETASSGAGTDFFERLVQCLAEALEVKLVFVGTVAATELATLALFDTDRLVTPVPFPLPNSPCELTLEHDDIFSVPQGLIPRFPHVALLPAMRAESYLGHALRTPEGERLGVLAVIHDAPLERTAELDSLLRTCAVRATHELMRRKAVADLARSEAELRESQRIAHVGSWSFDLQRRQARRSPEHIAMFGGDPKDPGLSSLLDRVHPDDRNDFEAALARFAGGAGGGAFVREVRVVLPSAEVRWILVRAELRRDPQRRPIELTGTSQDVTEQRRLHHQLKTAEKLEAVGRLASGVAHDFNNVLTVIQANASLLGRAALTADARETLEDIVSAADRGADLVKQLMAFGRPGRGGQQAIDLSVVVAQAERLLQRTLGEEYEVRVERAAEPMPVRVDAADLDRVLLNLSLNARDAMSANVAPRPKTLTLRTKHQGVAGVLEVQDTGVGIAPEVLPRLFEPFFTTKPVGQGTGLGLPSVYAIAHGVGGDVEVDSAVGVGTTVRVFFPLVEPTPVAPTTAPALVQLKGRRALLAEDDASVRQTMRRLLERLGLAVTPAVDGQQALELWEREGGFDVLITDVRMPRLNGFDLAEKLWAGAPSLPVVFLSGYFDVEPPAQRPTMRLVNKPVTMAVMSAALEGLLAPTGG